LVSKVKKEKKKKVKIARIIFFSVHGKCIKSQSKMGNDDAVRNLIGLVHRLLDSVNQRWI
jgi:hypothetical protein